MNYNVFQIVTFEIYNYLFEISNFTWNLQPRPQHWPHPEALSQLDQNSISTTSRPNLNLNLNPNLDQNHNLDHNNVYLNPDHNLKIINVTSTINSITSSTTTLSTSSHQPQPEPQTQFYPQPDLNHTSTIAPINHNLNYILKQNLTSPSPQPKPQPTQFSRQSRVYRHPDH